MSNLKELIKNCNDIETEVIEIEEWKCSIEIHTITARERADILNEVVNEKGETDHGRLHAHMAIAASYDPKTHEKIFTKDDVEWLLEKCCGAIEKIFKKAMDLSGMTKEAAEQMKKK